MKYRDLARQLTAAGFSGRPGKGDHEVWSHPVGVTVVIVRDTDCSPGVCREALAGIQQARAREQEATR
ncbi:MAG: type II toxin-antitoxin system HicA family toxin [Propionibacteriaceae bacterium]|jgi:predicted RNA binding protein YcfA (HicA-like mRNA interferase family)|nr:type II toxin-antitoxin system HicA family toxin [Propionibacteriaceae bacterium]